MIQLDITITMGEDSRTMSLEEARELYDTLGQMFRTGSAFSQNDYNLARGYHTEPVSELAPFMKTTYPNRKPAPDPQMKPQIDPVQAKPSKEQPNLRKSIEDRLSVEKAVDRARRRTSGCRSGNKHAADNKSSGCSS